MCIIVYKPAGVKFPAKSLLKKCFDNNPDGAGFMVPLNGHVAIRKGFMKFPDLMDALAGLTASGADLKALPLVLHFRITTQGGVKPGLCHPYPVCSSYDRMLETSVDCPVGVAHNGIITHCSDYGYRYGAGSWEGGKYTPGKHIEPKNNDTMEWIKRFADPIIANDPFFARSSRKLSLLKDPAVSGSYNKFAIMSKTGFVQLLGDFVSDPASGCFFSNHSFELSQYVYWKAGCEDPKAPKDTAKAKPAGKSTGRGTGNGFVQACDLLRDPDFGGPQGFGDGAGPSSDNAGTSTAPWWPNGYDDD